MTLHRTRLVLVALAILLASQAPAVRADGPAAPAEPRKDGRPVSSDEAGLAAIERFERAFKGRDIGVKMGAVHSLSQTKNDLVTKRLEKLLRHQEEEVRMGVALVLADMYQNEKMAGEVLRKFITSSEENEEVMISCLLSLGRLLHVDAIPEMGEVCKKHGNVFVKIEALKAFGKMKDKRALVPILDLWLMNPQGFSWEGGEVTVDTGAPGDTDQKAAEAAYKAKYGGQQRRGAPPTMLKTYIQTIVESVHLITGEKLKDPSELMRWMVQHEKELGYPLPAKVKTDLKDWEERAAKKKKAKEKEKG
jgi:hypothetical protein